METVSAVTHPGRDGCQGRPVQRPVTPSLRRLSALVLLVLAGTVFTVSSYLASRAALERPRCACAAPGKSLPAETPAARPPVAAPRDPAAAS